MNTNGSQSSVEQESTFITLDKQLSKALSVSALDLDKLVKDFKELSQNKWKSFEDLKLCKAIEVPINKILIDQTKQRPLNVKQIHKILKHFNEGMVDPIAVYKDPVKSGYYISFDGQHTATALYIICTRVFGQRASDVIIPVVIYNEQMKLDIHRKNKYFILDSLNMRETKQSLSELWALFRFKEQHYNKLAGDSWPTFSDYCENSYIVNDEVRNEIESYKESLSYEQLEPEGPNIIRADKEPIISKYQETYSPFHQRRR